METVESYLSSKGVRSRQGGSGELHVHCFFCNEDPGRPGRLYINSDTGVFFCHLCEAKGHINTLRAHFGDPPILEDGSIKQAKVEKPIPLNLFRAAAEFYHDALRKKGNPEREMVLDYLFKERGLTKETVQKHLLGWGIAGLKDHLVARGFSEEECVSSGLIATNGYEILSNKITIPYVTHGQVVQVRGKDIGGKYVTPTHNSVRLFNVDSTENADRVVICEGEFDALVLEQLGYHAVGAPGANAFPEGWKVYFQDIKKIYVCFDNDVPGIKGAENVLRILGPTAKMVTMPGANGGPKNDPSEWIIKKGHTKEDFEALLAPLNASKLLVSVHEAYEEWLKYEGNVNRGMGISTGYATLDAKIEPGLMPGQVMVIMAKTGQGKTMILLNMFHRIFMKDTERDKKILFVSLEQTRNEWFQRARWIYKFYKATIGAPDPPDKEIIDFYADRFMLIDKNRVTPEELTHTITEYVEALAKPPDLIAVDYLGYWARAFRGEGYERTTAAIMEMKKMAKEIKTPFISPSQVKRAADAVHLTLDSARDSGAVEETSDFLLGFSRKLVKVEGAIPVGSTTPDAMLGLEGTQEIELKIHKSRHGGADQHIILHNGPLSLVLVPDTDKELVERVSRQWFCRDKGMKHDEWLERERLGIYETDPDWRERKDGLHRSNSSGRGDDTGEVGEVHSANNGNTVPNPPADGPVEEIREGVLPTPPGSHVQEFVWDSNVGAGPAN